MKTIEQEDRLFQQNETGDKEGTYEQKNGNDAGSQTVYLGNNNKLKTKKKLSEKIVFLD